MWRGRPRREGVHLLQASQFDRLTLQFDPPSARLTLSHPPLNVIDLAMMDELSSALAEIEANPQISTIVIEGAGNCFSAGVDVAAHAPDQAPEMLQKFHAVIRAVVSTKNVTIAAVHGSCLGGAAELAMVCDMVITTESATWAFPEIKLGCFPPVAASALSVLVGQKRAAELILTGASITGAKAANIGLATIAVPDVQLSAALDEKLVALESLSPAALALAKKAIYAWDAAHFDKGLARAEKIYLDELIQCEDAQEGIRAFLEKRPPQWASHKPGGENPST